jgi:hypothetical protein
VAAPTTSGWHPSPDRQVAGTMIKALTLLAGRAWIEARPFFLHLSTPRPAWRSESSVRSFFKTSAKSERSDGVDRADCREISGKPFFIST